MFISKRDTELNDFQEIHVTTDSLISVIRRSLEIANRTSNDSREFRVLLTRVFFGYLLAIGIS